MYITEGKQVFPICREREKRVWCEKRDTPVIVNSQLGSLGSLPAPTTTATEKLTLTSTLANSFFVD